MPTSKSPARLQFRLRNFVEHESTDAFMTGASDEVYIGATGLDSATVVVGPDGRPAVTQINAGPIGDVSEPTVSRPWRDTPYVLIEFDLSRPSDWPRSFVVTLFVVEEDNQKIAETFAKLHSEVGGALKEAAVRAVSAGAGALVGAAIGSAFPGAGSAIGAGMGALAGLAYDEIISVIADTLKNEIFTPRPLVLETANPARLKQLPESGEARVIEITEHGARYTIEYDWNITDGVWARPKAPVTAIKTREADGHCSLFVTGYDGKVWTNFWPKPETTEWFGWYPVGDSTFPEGAPVTAIKTREADGHCSLFVTHSDGKVWTNFWPKPETTEWFGWYPVGENTFPEGAPVTAIKTSEADGHCSLFVTGYDGKVWTNFWPKPETTEWFGWYPVGENRFPVHG